MTPAAATRTRPARVRSAARGWEKRREADERVLQNLEPELHELWLRVKGLFQGTPENRERLFRQYAHEHPEEIVEAQQAAADDWLAVQQAGADLEFPPPEPEPDPEPEAPQGQAAIAAAMSSLLQGSALVQNPRDAAASRERKAAVAAVAARKLGQVPRGGQESITVAQLLAERDAIAAAGKKRKPVLTPSTCIPEPPMPTKPEPKTRRKPTPKPAPEPEAPMLQVGDRVRTSRTGDVGTILAFIEPKPGWHRARVRWTDDTDQYVDVDKLTRAPEPAPEPEPEPEPKPEPEPEPEPEPGEVCELPPAEPEPERAPRRKLRMKPAEERAARAWRFGELLQDYSKDMDRGWKRPRELERFALVQRDDVTKKHWISTHETPDDVAAWCDEDDSGFEPVRVVDLETGDEYEVERQHRCRMVVP